MTEQDQEVVKQILRDMLLYIDETAQIQTEVAQEGATVIFNVITRDSGSLIGARGSNLDALQFLTRVISFRRLSQPARFVVDVDGYKKNREEFLRELARAAATRVRETKETLLLKPMPAHERRIVHDELNQVFDVSTESRGEDPERQVLIKPKG